MKDSQGNLVLGRTRWRRFAAVALPAAALGAGLMAGVANGAVPIAVNVSGQTFKVSAGELVGDGFAQYPSVVIKPNNDNIPVAGTDIASATIVDLCQSVRVTNPLTGDPVSLVIRGGRAEGSPVTARNLQIGLDQLGGNAEFTNIDIGTDASRLTKGGSTAPGLPGMPGQEASRVVITDLRQVAYSTHAGTFTVPGLTLKIDLAGGECFDTIE